MHSRSIQFHGLRPPWFFRLLSVAAFTMLLVRPSHALNSITYQFGLTGPTGTVVDNSADDEDPALRRVRKTFTFTVPGAGWGVRRLVLLGTQAPSGVPIITYVTSSPVFQTDRAFYNTVGAPENITDSLIVTHNFGAPGVSTISHVGLNGNYDTVGLFNLITLGDIRLVGVVENYVFPVIDPPPYGGVTPFLFGGSTPWLPTGSPSKHIARLSFKLGQDNDALDLPASVQITSELPDVPAANSVVIVLVCLLTGVASLIWRRRVRPGTTTTQAV